MSTKAEREKTTDYVYDCAVKAFMYTAFPECRLNRVKWVVGKKAINLPDADGALVVAKDVSVTVSKKDIIRRIPVVRHNFTCIDGSELVIYRAADTRYKVIYYEWYEV